MWRDIKAAAGGFFGLSFLLVEAEHIRLLHEWWKEIQMIPAWLTTLIYCLSPFVLFSLFAWRFHRRQIMRLLTLKSEVAFGESSLRPGAWVIGCRSTLQGSSRLSRSVSFIVADVLCQVKPLMLQLNRYDLLSFAQVK